MKAKTEKPLLEELEELRKAVRNLKAYLEVLAREAAAAEAAELLRQEYWRERGDT